MTPLRLSAVAIPILLAFSVAVSPSALVLAVLSPDSCSQDVDISSLAFPVPLQTCTPVWSKFNFILRHSYDKAAEKLSVILSANTHYNWFSMGWSPRGTMVGASAMVGYLSIDGKGIIEQYYLAGKTTSEVIPNEGNLTVVPNSTLVTIQNQTIYMAFQIIINASLASSSNLIYAYAFNGQTPDDTGHISSIHQDRYQMSLDFTRESSTSMSTDHETLARSHGIVNIFAWAILAPIGGFIARYLRQCCAPWFYLHASFQTCSFILGIAGIASGIKLTYDLPDTDWEHHRILGIFVFVLATLQVTALCLRPGKDSNYRKFWNWGHFIVGRFVLFLAAVNIVVGIRLADAGTSWRAGYASILIVTLVAFFILEGLYWYKWYNQRRNPTTAPALSNYEMM